MTDSCDDDWHLWRWRHWRQWWQLGRFLIDGEGLGDLTVSMIAQTSGGKTNYISALLHPSTTYYIALPQYIDTSRLCIALLHTSQWAIPWLPRHQEAKPGKNHHFDNVVIHSITTALHCYIAMHWCWQRQNPYCNNSWSPNSTEVDVNMQTCTS